MKRLARVAAIAATVFGALTASPSVYAHATYNVGGYGDISTGASNTTIGGTGNARIYTGGTTGGGVAGSLNHSGTTGGGEVWANGAPSEWVGSTGAPSATSNSVLPSAGYIGLHSNVTARLAETGTYCGAAVAADCVGGANSNTNSLLRQVYNRNHAATANYPGSAYSGNLLPSDLSLAVAGNSWQVDGSGNPVFNSGMDVLNPHVSTGSEGNLEQNVIDLAGGSPVFLNIDLYDDKADGLGDQQLGFALYGGWDKGNGMSDLTLIGSALALVGPSGHAQMSYQLIGTFFGEYTVLIGDASDIGGQYKANFSVTTGSALYSVAPEPVPVPAAIWLFGSALAGMGVIGRRKKSVA